MCLWQPSLGVKWPGRALLYVILCQAGSYFNSEADAISLWADPKYTRAWKGGTGDCKMGGWVDAYCMKACLNFLRYQPWHSDIRLSLIW